MTELPPTVTTTVDILPDAVFDGTSKLSDSVREERVGKMILTHHTVQRHVTARTDVDRVKTKSVARVEFPRCGWSSRDGVKFPGRCSEPVSHQLGGLEGSSSREGDGVPGTGQRVGFPPTRGSRGKEFLGRKRSCRDGYRVPWTG